MARLHTLPLVKLLFVLVLSDTLCAQASNHDITLTVILNPPDCRSNYGSIIITAAGGKIPYKFRLNNSYPGNTGNFTLLKAGHYEIVVTDANDNTVTEKVTLTQTQFPPLLTVAAGFMASSCTSSDAGIILEASGGTPPYQYSYDKLNYQASNRFIGLNGGHYTFFVKDANGCIGSTTPRFLGDFFPTTNCILNIRSRHTFQTCGPDGILDVEVVDWPNSPHSFSLDGQNFQSTGKFSGLAAGIYRLHIKDANGNLKVIKTYPIYPYCEITMNSVAVDATCGMSDGKLAISAENGKTPFTYTIDGVNYQASNIFNGLASGIYNVTARDANGVTSSSTVTIRDLCPLDIKVNTIDAICGADDGQVTASALNGTPPFMFSIDGINFQANNTFKNLEPGTYTITVKDKFDKIGETFFVIKEINDLGISIHVKPASCINGNGQLTIMAAGGAIPYQYSLDGNIQTINVFSQLKAGNYSATVIDANGCRSSEPISIDLDNDLHLEAGDDISICEGKGTNLTILSNATNVLWSPSVDIDSTDKTPFVSPAATTEYHVKAVLGDCEKHDSIMVLVNPAPIARAGVNDTICFGQSSQLNGIGGEEFFWSPPTYLSDPLVSNPAVIKPANTTTYFLNVIDANGCTSIQPSAVTVFITPAEKLFAGNDTLIAINEPIQLNAIDVSNSGFIHYNWSPAYGLSDYNIQNPIARLSKDMTFIVNGSTLQGCEGYDTVQIKVFNGPEIYVPTAFTPNNDGLNDMLKAMPVGIRTFKLLSIYNRWGTLVFQTSDPRKGWNGEINSHVADTGLYVWMAEATDAKGKIITRKGSVMLIR